MSTNQPEPNDARLSELLREACVSPGLPLRFQQNVWRRIEDSETAVESVSWLDALANLILRPRFAGAAAAVVLLAGVVMGAVEGRQVAHHDAQMNYVSSVAPQALP